MLACADLLGAVEQPREQLRVEPPLELPRAPQDGRALHAQLLERVQQLAEQAHLPRPACNQHAMSM